MHIYTEYKMLINQLILPQIESVPSRFLSLAKLLKTVSRLSLLHVKVTIFSLACSEKRGATKIANIMAHMLRSCFQ